MATELLSGLIRHPGFFSLVAELDGQIVGSSFLDERAMITGVGHVTVDPAVQDRRIGRALMETMLQRCAQRSVPGVRLLQAAYNYGSMSLYAKLGFDVREPFAAMQGDPLALHTPGYRVRAATSDDLPTCDALCVRVHGPAGAVGCAMRSPRGRRGWLSVMGQSPDIRAELGFMGTRWQRPTTT